MQQQYHLHQSWLWLLLLPLLCLTSCSGADTDDAGSQHPATSSVPISFTALSKWDEAQAKSSSAPHTRLSEDATTKTLSFDKDDAIGVFAYLNNSDSPNFMNNQKVTYDGSNWNYSPVKYWPNNEADKLSFYAYYPYDYENIHVATSTTPCLTYYSKEADCDVLAAIALRQQHSVQNGNVSLLFKHLLAKVKFTFSSAGTSHPVIHALKYEIPCKGVSNLSYPLQFEEVSKEKYTLLRFVSQSEGVVINTTGIRIDEFTAFILPCDISKFSVSINNVYYEYTPASPIEIKAGCQYTINFVISGDHNSNFFITSYTLWETDENTYESDLK